MIVVAKSSSGKEEEEKKIDAQESKRGRAQEKMRWSTENAHLR